MHASAKRYVIPELKLKTRPILKPSNCGAYTTGEFVAVLLKGRSTVVDDPLSATDSAITIPGSYPSY